MTYATIETSTYLGSPFELYWFSTSTESWYYTSGDEQRTQGGQTYLVETIERTELDYSQEIVSQTVAVRIPITSGVAQKFIAYIPSDPMSLVIYRGHENDTDGQVLTYFTGRVASAKFTDVCELTVVPEQSLLKRGIPGPRYQAQCNWVLFGPGCGVNKDLFKVTGAVSAVGTDTITCTSFGSKPDGYFNAGYVEVGDERRMILSHTGNVVQVITPIAGLSAGSPIAAYAGCQRTESDCQSKFSNLVNFSGFARIPTKNPFAGSIT